jgi:iron complex transport system substrate-binding protein
MRKLVVALSVLACLAFTACGDDEQEPAASGSSTAAEEPAAAAFPVTIEHRYGSTEIPAKPERVVVVGLNEQDAFLALGTTPVGVTDWMGYENGIAPWAEDSVQGEKPELLTNTDGIQYEKVAALQPDVIVALYSDLEKADYDKLTAIAPVVAAPEGYADFGIPWELTTKTVGRILGEQEKADELVAGLEGRIDEAAADHPEWKGEVGAMAMYFEGIWVYGAEDPRMRLFERLGLARSPELEKLVGKEFAKVISEERTDLLDVDVLAWLTSKADWEKLGKDRIYANLAVHREDRDFAILDDRPDAAYNAVGAQTVLSLPVALDVLIPALEEALPAEG